MEILMKVKCSPSTSNTATHSTLKVVDHHHQLQQHTLPPPHMRAPPPPHKHMHDPGMTLLRPPPPSAPVMPPPPQEPMCMEYANSMDCCAAAATAAAAHDMVDLHWAPQHRVPSGLGPSFSSIREYSSNMSAFPYEQPACCSGINYGRAASPARPPLWFQQPLAEMQDLDAPYEYQEPEENFVSIDDAKVKGFLLRMSQASAQQQQQLEQEKELLATKGPEEAVVYEIIELDDEAERERLNRLRNQAEEKATIAAQHLLRLEPQQGSISASISLIPKKIKLLPNQ